MTALSASTGQVVWQKKGGWSTGLWISSLPTAIAPERVFHTSGVVWMPYEGRLAALNPHTGEILWASAVSEVGEFYPRLIPYAGSLYFYKDSHLVAYQGTGKVKAAAEPAYPVTVVATPPAGSDGEGSRTSPQGRQRLPQLVFADANSAMQYAEQLQEELKADPSKADSPQFQATLEQVGKALGKYAAAVGDEATYSTNQVMNDIKDGNYDFALAGMVDAYTSVADDLDKVVNSRSLKSVVKGTLWEAAKTWAWDQTVGRVVDGYVDTHYDGPDSVRQSIKDMTRPDPIGQLRAIRSIIKSFNEALKSAGQFAALPADVPIYGKPRWLLPMTWDRRADMAPYLAKLRQAGITVVWMPTIGEMLNWGPQIQSRIATGIPPEAAISQVLPREFLQVMSALGNHHIDKLRLAFPDLRDHWSRSDVESIFDQGIVNGMPDGTFAPDQPLTRAALVKLLVLAAGIKPEPEAAAPVPALKEHWLVKQGYLQAAVKRGIVRLADYKTFEPEGTIARSEIAVFTMRTLGQSPANSNEAQSIFSDLKSGDDQILGYIARAYKVGIVKGYDTPQGKDFRPDFGATRAEAVVMVRRLQAQLWNR